MLFSGLLGWWGFPWGLLLTPVQVVRNIVEMVGGPKPGHPTPLLAKIVGLETGAGMVQHHQSLKAHSAPQPPPLALNSPGD